MTFQSSTLDSDFWFCEKCERPGVVSAIVAEHGRVYKLFVCTECKHEREVAR